MVAPSAVQGLALQTHTCLQFGLGLWPSKADGSPIWRVLALEGHWEEAGSAVCFSLQEAGFLCH